MSLKELINFIEMKKLINNKFKLYEKLFFTNNINVRVKYKCEY